MPYPLKLIIFTDLNDTLLDRNYRFEPAREALESVRKYDIPLIICTSKTRRQVELYRKSLRLNYPIIAENGGGIYFPPGSFPVGRLPEGCLRDNGEFIFELSRTADKLLPELLQAAEQSAIPIKTIYDMSVDEIMELSGMSREESELSKQRRYSIYFLCKGDRGALFAELERRGLKPTWGSYFCHLGAYNDKGVAVHKMISLYRSLGFFDFTSLALGDNMNDYAMMREVERPVLVERPGGGHFAGIDLDEVDRVAGVGPIGWNRAVLKLIESIDWD